MSNLETMKKGLERVEEAHRLLAQTAIEYGVAKGSGYISNAMDSVSSFGNFLRARIEKIENTPKVPRTIRKGWNDRGIDNDH